MSFRCNSPSRDRRSLTPILIHEASTRVTCSARKLTNEKISAYTAYHLRYLIRLHGGIRRRRSGRTGWHTRGTRCRTTRGTSGLSIRRGRGRRPRIARSSRRRAWQWQMRHIIMYMRENSRFEMMRAVGAKAVARVEMMAVPPTMVAGELSVESSEGETSGEDYRDGDYSDIND